MTRTSTQVAARHSPAAALMGVRRGVDVAFAALSAAFTIAVLVQVYLAGAGAFAHHSGPHVVHHAFAPHETLGNMLGIAAIVLFVLALIAHVNKATMIGAFVLALLTEVAQHGLAQSGHDNRWVGGVHAFDGMVILLLAVWLAIAGYRRNRAG